MTSEEEIVKAKNIASVWRALLCAPACLALCVAATAAAPVIREVGSDENSNFGQVGARLIITGENFDGTTTDVLFGALLGTNVKVATGRGMLFVTVPSGATTGNVIVRVDGVSSAAFPFTVNAGTFSPGANTVSGQVTASGVPKPNTGMALLQPDSCGNGGMVLWDYALTDVSGFYTLNWPGAGTYYLFTMTRLADGLSAQMSPVAGSGNVTQNVALTADTTVTGTVLSPSATPLPNAKVNFDGNGFEPVLTDASGNFSVHLSPGSWRMQIEPPVDFHARLWEENITVGAATPQPLGSRTLLGGIWITGTLVDDSTPTPQPVASAYVSASPANGGQNYSWTNSRGGGAFGIEVSSSTAFQLDVQTARTGPLVDVQLTFGPYSVDTNVGTITLGHAGYVTGTVQDEGLAPLPNVGMQAQHAISGSFLDWTNTCADGTYILKVPSAGTTVPVRATAQFWNDSRPYAVQTYNNKVFQCEGDTINVAGTATVPGINFTLHPGGSVSGQVTQYFGGAPLANINVGADDGQPHNCTLGGWPPTGAGGTYQLDHLPVIPLRFWALNVGPTYSSGSYSNKIYPQYTAVTPTAGTVTPNINISLRPPVAPRPVPDGTGGTQAGKVSKQNADASLVTATWDVATCPPPTNHDFNALVGKGSTLSSYALIGSLCGLGLTGTYSGPMPPIPAGERFLWWVLVQSGGSGATESSWGRNSAGFERNGPSASNQCQDTNKDASMACP